MIRIIVAASFQLALVVVVGSILTQRVSEGSDRGERQRTTSRADAKAGWPLFRGNPAQTGVAEGKLPDKLDELWKFTADDGIEGAVAVADGVVFAGSLDEHLYALSLKDGKPKWKYKGGPFKAPVSVRKGRVYLGDLDGLLHCVDAAKGTKVWTFEAKAEANGVNFHGDDVLFTSHDENLYCLDKDGKEKWKFKTEGQIYGSVALSGARTFLAGCDSEVHVIDVAKGTEPGMPVPLGGQTGATVAVLGDMLYVGTMSNEVKAIDWKKGAVAWTYKPVRGNAFFSSPAVTDKYVVIGSRDNRVHAVNRKDGSEAWMFTTKNRVDSSPVVVGNRVVVGSLDGHLYVLDLATGKEVQKLKLDSPVAASPAVVEGKVLIGTQRGALYCFGAKQ